MEYNTDYLIAGPMRGDKRCASLLMSLIENDSNEGEECLRVLCTIEERSYVLGITGWPGAGKSTLGGCPRIQYAILYTICSVIH